MAVDDAGGWCGRERRLRPTRRSVTGSSRISATTLFVEAGAGSGKTIRLVDRVLGLVATGTAELRTIAAITFTEKAGAELRDRIRRALEERVERHRPTQTSIERCQAAIDQLDGAAIGTLHSFAQRILSENPVEAGLPPRVEVLDEVSSGTEFERRWAGFRDELLDEPELERTLLLLFATGVKHAALRSLALAFDQNWDLVEERVPEDTRRTAARSTTCSTSPRAARRSLRAQGSLHRPHRQVVRPTGRDRRLRRGPPLDRRRARAARRACRTRARSRLRRSRSGTSAPRANVGRPLDEVQVPCPRRRRRARRDARIRSSQACAKRIGSALRGFTLSAAEERRTAGQLAFHDLLVLSRAAAPRPGAGRRRAQRDSARRYSHLLLDEFQDTDPIQIELAVRIAAAEPSSAEAGAGAMGRSAGGSRASLRRGRPEAVDLPVPACRHLDVPDRRRALRAARAAGWSSCPPTSVRSQPVIDWVNTTFATLMAEVPEVELSVPSQPDYVPLTRRSTCAAGRAVRCAVGPATSWRESASAADIREAEAAEVAPPSFGRSTEGWSVGRSSGDRAAWRPACLGDITVLVPARTSLPFLEDALEKASIPYRAESSSLVYSTRAVRDLLMVLRAADDPTDHLRIVSALRSPLMSCGDDDLFRFKVERGGHWNYLADQPDSVPG